MDVHEENHKQEIIAAFNAIIASEKESYGLTEIPEYVIRDYAQFPSPEANELSKELFGKLRGKKIAPHIIDDFWPLYNMTDAEIDYWTAERNRVKAGLLDTLVENGITRRY